MSTTSRSFQPTMLHSKPLHDSARSHASDDSVQHKARVYHRLGLDHANSHAIDTTQWKPKGIKAGYRPNRQIMQMAGGMTGRHNEKRRQMYKDSMLPEVFDIDGDGQVDEWEYKMADIFRQMTKEDIEDMDGDGDVDEDDLKIARELRGKTMLVQELVDGLEAPLWMYDRSWIGRKPRDLVKDAITSNNFPNKMKNLRGKERMYQLSSSHLMRDSLKNPETTRFEERNLSARGFFKEDRNRHKEKQIWNATRKVKEAQPFNRNHGDIPSYGNFSNYKSICLKQGVNLAATGHN